MELFFIILVFLLLFIGLVGSFFPAIPGPPISYGALLLSHFYIFPLKDKSDLWLWALVVVIVTILDFWVQIYGVKKFGGGKMAVNGSIIGLIIGIFFIPGIGLIIGSFLGAFIGAKIEGRNINNAFKIALGAFTGFVLGTLLKLIVSLYIIYIIIDSITNIC
tara:strand:- start:74 stop:559 length:486 start_codon:yes stop_codon:yes gene_type:complete